MNTTSSPILATVELQNTACQTCTAICGSRKHVVNGKGYIPASIMAIVESPSVQDDKVGLLMTGPTGADYRRVLRLAGIDDSLVFTTSLTRCLAVDPVKNISRLATDEEIGNCETYLGSEIRTVKPNVLVAFGPRVASKLLGEDYDFGQVRGIERWSEKYKCKVITTYSPEFLQVRPEVESILVQDLKNALKISKYPESTPPYMGNYIIAEDVETADGLFDRLSEVPRFTFDIETNGLNFMKDKVMCISFSWKSGTACLIPITRYDAHEEKYTELVDKKVRKKKGQEPTVQKVPVERIRIIDEYKPYWGDKQDYILGRLKQIFALDSEKIAHNGKFDSKFLKRYLGIEVNNFCFDTMLAHYMLDENMIGMHDLKSCATMYTDAGNYEAELEKWFKDHKISDKKRNYGAVPTDILYKYASMDADVTLQLFELFERQIEEQNLHDVFYRLIMPLSHTLQNTEYCGIRIDMEYLEKLGIDLQTESTRLHDEMINQIGPSILASIKAKNTKGEDINFGSPKQLGELLFTHLNLPILSRTEKSKAPATDDETLQELAKLHKVPALIVQYRSVNKLLSTYVNGLKEAVDSNGYVHASFLIHTTTTGRLSSQDPNLQNIPKDDKRIKNLFIPREGKVFIEADYSQAEFRHWANYSQDPQIMKDLWDGLDIHRFMASQAAGHNVKGVQDLALIPADVVTKDMRQAAKRIVFGLMNGMGVAKLAKQEKCSEEHAKKVIRLFFGRYPVAKRWLDGTIDTARRDGQIRNIFGRTRRLPGANCYNSFMRSESERMAKNSPIQSAASDMNCNAANRINAKFEELGIDAQLCVLVHDSLLYEVPQDRIDECLKIIVAEMKRPIQSINVPMDAEVKIGGRWGEVQEVKV